MNLFRQHDDDWGLGVIHPGAVHFLGGFSGEPNVGGPSDNPTGYLAPVRREVLDHNIVYEYRYSLILDTLENIRKQAVKQRPKSGLPDYRFRTDRQHWWFVNAEDTGYPIKHHLQLFLEKDDPHMFGPEGFWKAKDVPRLFIRAAFRTRTKVATVFWETAEKPGFDPDQMVTFEIEPDGKFQTYEVNLSSSQLYRGTIRRLRFDPVQAGVVGESVKIEFISVKKN